MLKLLIVEVENLVKHRDQGLKDREFTPYKSSELLPSIGKDGQVLLEEMPIHNTLLVTLSIIE